MSMWTQSCETLNINHQMFWSQLKSHHAPFVVSWYLLSFPAVELGSNIWSLNTDRKKKKDYGNLDEKHHHYKAYLTPEKC